MASPQREVSLKLWKCCIIENSTRVLVPAFVLLLERDVKGPIRGLGAAQPAGVCERASERLRSSPEALCEEHFPTLPLPPPHTRLGQRLLAQGKTRSFKDSGEKKNPQNNLDVIYFCLFWNDH